MAVTEDARAQATAGEEMTVGRRVHTVHHGQGSPALFALATAYRLPRAQEATGGRARRLAALASPAH
jgi:hypothetical protein